MQCRRLCVAVEICLAVWIWGVSGEDPPASSRTCPLGFDHVDASPDRASLLQLSLRGRSSTSAGVFPGRLLGVQEWASKYDWIVRVVRVGKDEACSGILACSLGASSLGVSLAGV